MESKPQSELVAVQEPGTLIVTDADRKFWVKESVITVAQVLERGQYAEFNVMSGSGTIWVNPARVVHLEEKGSWGVDA